MSDHISEADFISLRERMKANGAPASEDSPAPAAEDMLEAPIEAECTKILEARGWRALKTDPVRSRSRGKGFGEPGMADHLYLNYGRGAAEDGSDDKVLWVEFKRSLGGRVSKTQLAWHEKERARGARTGMAGVDFAPTVEGFTRWIDEQGF